MIKGNHVEHTKCLQNKRMTFFFEVSYELWAVDRNERERDRNERESQKDRNERVSQKDRNERESQKDRDDRFDSYCCFLSFNCGYSALIGTDLCCGGEYFMQIADNGS